MFIKTRGSFSTTAPRIERKFDEIKTQKTKKQLESITTHGMRSITLYRKLNKTGSCRPTECCQNEKNLQHIHNFTLFDAGRGTQKRTYTLTQLSKVCSCDVKLLETEKLKDLLTFSASCISKLSFPLVNKLEAMDVKQEQACGIVPIDSLVLTLLREKRVHTRKKSYQCNLTSCFKNRSKLGDK